MGYQYPFYTLCEQSNKIERKNIYQTCFNTAIHAEHLQDEHAYFLQFKAAAITSVILVNKDLHKHAKRILALIDVANNLKALHPYTGLDCWSMLKPIKTNCINYSWRKLVFLFDETGYMSDDIISLPLWSFYIEGNNVLN